MGRFIRFPQEVGRRPTAETGALWVNKYFT
jgi:hypothetical protein